MEAIKSLLNAVKALFVKLFSIFKTKSTEKVQVVQDAVQDKVQDVKEQVQDKVQEVADKVQDVADNVK